MNYTHKSTSDLLDDVETMGVLGKCAVHAAIMDDWLAADCNSNVTPFSWPDAGGRGMQHVPSELVLWCRIARDLLKGVSAHGRADA
jgi:hypothetical protein